MANANRSVSDFATTRNGARIAYHVIKGGGPDHCVLLHSLAMTGVFWDRLVPFLKGTTDILIDDCRGCTGPLHLLGLDCLVQAEEWA